MKKFVIFVFMLCIMISAVFAASSSSSSSSDILTTTSISISLVNQDPDPAVAGDIVEVRLGVENLGGVSANNLMIEFIPSYPFTLVTGDSAIQKVGTIKGFQTGENMRIVKYSIKVDKDATAGSYELKIRYYEEGSSAKIQKSFSVDVTNKESAEVIYIDKSILVPGKEDTLRFTINNVGNAPLRDLTFSWINEDQIILPVGSDNTKYIKYIDVGDSAELEYRVIADTNIDAGLYKLDLYLTYDDPLTGEEKEISTIAGVYVGGGTDFDVAFSETSSGQTSFTIANVGSNPAFSVSVIVPEQSGWSVSGSNSMIIGNLNTGDYTVASFALTSSQMRQIGTTQQRNMSEQLTQRTSTQTSNNLKIQIAYTDTMGKREIIEKEVAMNQQASTTSTITNSQTNGFDVSMLPYGRISRRQQSFFSKYKWYIVVFLVLAILGVGYWKYRKEKLINPNYKIKDLFKIKELFKKKKK